MTESARGPVRILAFAGPIGSGKSTLTRALAQQLGWKRASFGSYVKEKSKGRGLPDTRATLQELGVTLVVEKGWEPFCREVLDYVCWVPGEPLLVAGIRHEEALQALRRVVAPSRVALVYVRADIKVRKARLRANRTEYAESLEAVEQHSTELQVERILPSLADLEVDGTLAIGDLVRTVAQFAAAGELQPRRVLTEAHAHISAIRAWLEDDQYEHGEWGRFDDDRDPTSELRTFESSRRKPNLFSSCQVAYALAATGPVGTPALLRFIDWMARLRDEGGRWTSSAGSNVPIGTSRERASSTVPNVRHTAKGLDLLFLRREFRADDAETFRWVLRRKLPAGAYPHHEGGGADLWATAYVMNLLLRALSGENPSLTIPRSYSPARWREEIRSHLDGARTWLCEQRRGDGLWTFSDRNPLVISEAVALEVGGDLSAARPDVCASLAPLLLESVSSSRSAKAAWALLLMWSALDADAQRRTIVSLPDVLERDWTRDDNLEVSCLLRLFWLARDPLLLRYYASLSNGHESALPAWHPWATSEYERWYVQRALERANGGPIEIDAAPKDKAGAWLTVLAFVAQFRHQVEMNRGWQLLWQSSGSEEPRKEDDIQVAFANMAGPLCKHHGISMHRETETGRGPVDFEFCNGVRATVELEFKRTDSGKLIDGVRAQVIEYADARLADSIIYVCVGFDDDGPHRFNAVQSGIVALQAKYPDLFIRAEFIDARRRASASKLTAPTRATNGASHG